LLFDFEISNYKTLLSHARGSFETDLNNIALNFPKILGLPKYQELQNDPNIWNLALIYSLADLAYKEHPVEDLLLYACQSLDQRYDQLDAAISQRLVQRLAQTTPSTNGKLTLSSEAIATEQLTFQLLQRADSLYHSINQMTYTLDNLVTRKIVPPAFQAYIDSCDAVFAATYPGNENYGKMEAEQLYQGEGQYLGLFGYRYADNGIFGQPLLEPSQRGLATEPSLAASFFGLSPLTDYYTPRISSFLRGTPNYDLLLSGVDRTADNYRKYFQTPDNTPATTYCQRGVQYIRDVQRLELIPYLEKGVNNLARFRDQAHYLQEKFLLNIEPNRTQLQEAQQLVDQADELLSAIRTEQTFWTTVYGSYDQQETFGFDFLRDMLTDGHYGDLKLSTSEVMLRPSEERTDDLFLTLHQKYNNGRLPYKDKGVLQGTIDTVYTLLEEHLARLYNQQAVPFNAAIVDLKVAGEEINHERSLALKAWIYTRDSVKFQQQKIQEQYEIQTGYRAMMDGPYDPSIPDSERQRLWQATVEQFAQDPVFQALQQQDEPLYNVYDSIYAHYDLLGKAAYEKLAAAIEAAGQTANSSVQPSARPAVIAPLRNLALERYRASILPAQDPKVGVLAEVYAPIDKSLADIDRQFTEVVVLQETLTVQLQQQVDLAASKLLEAQRNAKNLRVGMEMALQTLAAFRVPDTPLDSMFVTDTTVMKIALQPRSGITQTYDTLRINRRYVDDHLLEIPGSRWLTEAEFLELRNHPTQWNIFLGLLYQRLRTIENAPDFSTQGVALLAMKVFDLVYQTDQHFQAIRLKKALGNKLDFKDFYPFIKSSVDLFNTAITTPTVGESQLVVAEQFQGLQRVSEISDEALSLYENMYIKDYGNAIRNAMSLLSIFTNSNYDPYGATYVNNGLNIELSKKQQRLTDKQERGEYRTAQRAINAVLTYGTFMADMIEAETSEQVKTILQSATLPPGSSRIKREVTSNFTVNSYLGAAGAYDQIRDPLPGLEQGALGASLSVPIGFTYSFSPDKIFKQGGSFSIHVPIFDLGAITAFRANPSDENYTLEQLPDFSWRNLLSPGAFFVWNIKNSPFSLGAGGQIGPQLREITDLNTNATTTINSTRFPMIFFSVDVPFFNLHTGPKKIVTE
ncbi:MAG: hypothetical protein AAGJ82_06000, partial [Bacteroidota bacterium]